MMSRDAEADLTLCEEKMTTNVALMVAYWIRKAQVHADEIERLKAIIADHIRIGPVDEREYFERLDKELALMKLLSQPPPGPPNVPKPPYPRDVA
jgi:hypothetical protein